MHFLFVKHDLCFPRVSGHDVHSHGMIRALYEQGHSISLITVNPCTEPATEGIQLLHQAQFEIGNDDEVSELGLSKLQQKFCSYWGVPGHRITAVAKTAEQINADVVVAVGLDVLPYLSLVKNAQRIWYAADEWVIHHLSQFSLRRFSSWSNLKHAGVKGLYERAFTSVVDRTWLVSDRDARWTRRIMPGMATDVVPNGVDANFYRPQQTEEIQQSCVFWGRLDFGPNLDAIDWFCRHVWQNIQAQYPAATFSVFGFKAGEEVLRMAKQYKFKLTVDQPDIRRDICAHEIVVLPFVSGAGIKNKLLEAAGLGRPILASSHALNGVSTGQWNCIQSAAGKRQWIEELSSLWDDPTRRFQMGQSAREWVKQEYTWAAAAQRVVTSLEGETNVRFA